MAWISRATTCTTPSAPTCSAAPVVARKRRWRTTRRSPAPTMRASASFWSAAARRSPGARSPRKHERYLRPVHAHVSRHLVTRHPVRDVWSSPRRSAFNAYAPGSPRSFAFVQVLVDHSEHILRRKPADDQAWPIERADRAVIVDQDGGRRPTDLDGRDQLGIRVRHNDETGKLFLGSLRIFLVVVGDRDDVCVPFCKLFTIRFELAQLDHADRSVAAVEENHHRVLLSLQFVLSEG